jgi:subtilase family serine protease
MIRCALLAPIVCSFLLAACSSGSTPVPEAARPFLNEHAGRGVVARELCPAAKPGFGRCHAIQRIDAGDASASDPRAFAPFYENACFQGNAVCYSPQDLWRAYQLPAWQGGDDQTVAVVDAFHDSSAASDLNLYRSSYGLPPCTSQDGCFRQVGQTGSATVLPHDSSTWSGEESLDIEMVSAVCPRCRILLVEATSDDFRNFDMAENEAARLGATVISNSWSAAEWASSDPAYDHPGIAITASSGDDGYGTCASGEGCSGPQEPAAFSSVIAVGGTTLMPAYSTRGFAERTWNCSEDVPNACDLSNISATGSGCSGRVAKPPWQTDVGCKMRSYNDVSAVADVVTGVIAVDHGRWTIWGGTSIGAPIIAGAIALAGNARSLHGASGMWRSKGRGFFDITSGGDVVDGAGDPHQCRMTYAYICKARPGYDGPTGWGTPNGIAGL